MAKSERKTSERKTEAGGSGTAGPPPPEGGLAGFRIRACGEGAVLVEFGDPPARAPAAPTPSPTPSPVSPLVLPFARAASRSPARPSGIVEIIPAARTVLVGFDPDSLDAAAVRQWCAELAEDARRPYPGGAAALRRSPPAPPRGEARAEPSGTGVGPHEGHGVYAAGEPSGTGVGPHDRPDASAAEGEGADSTVTVPVLYDGPDLDDVAEETGLGRAGVIAAHTGTAWTVAFTGFAPGFGYLVGGDPRLHVARRDAPRTRVPAGSVGLAGAFSGVYPRASPGGWRLIGRTDARLWVPGRCPPALLAPGVRVRFAEVRP